MDSSLILAVKKTTKANNNKNNIFVLLPGRRGKVPICNGLQTFSSNGIFLKGRRYFTIRRFFEKTSKDANQLWYLGVFFLLVFLSQGLAI
jgi:hypothetical protein